MESARLLDAAANSGDHAARNFAVVLLLLRSGLRPGEACGLRAPDVDCKAGLMRVTGKTGLHTVALVRTACDVLERYLRCGYYRSRAFTLGVLFPNDAGTGPLNTPGLRGLIQDLCRAADIDRSVTTYWLRHTFATDAHRAGVEFPIISQALGHAKIVNTYTYVHGRESRMRQIVENGPASLPFADVQRALIRALQPDTSRSQKPGTPA